MGFYDKPLSIEAIFSKYDTNHDGKIDKKEVKSAKNIEHFDGFKVKNGMTLDVFEKKNGKAYAKYEQAATDAYNAQQKQINQWIECAHEEIDELKTSVQEDFEAVEKELEQEKEKNERILNLQKMAKEAGVPFTTEELMNESDDDLFILYDLRVQTKQKEEYMKLIDRAIKLGVPEAEALRMSEAQLKLEISRRLPQ